MNIPEKIDSVLILADSLICLIFSKISWMDNVDPLIASSTGREYYVRSDQASHDVASPSGLPMMLTLIILIKH